MMQQSQREPIFDLPDPREYEARLFPLRGHALYGDADRFEDCRFLMPAVLADFTQTHDFTNTATNLEICPSCFFNTSGTTSRSKRIPYTDNDLERQRIHEAIALKKLGMRRGDGVISLGAPLPSISGWAIVNGSETVGASVLNTSQLDYEDVFVRRQERRANIVIGTPVVVKEIGRAIREEYGALTDVFPNMRTGIIFGDVLPNRLRNDVRDIWGFKNIYSLYGTVEADVVATESTLAAGEMDLMFERLIFEIIVEAELEKERGIAGYQPVATDIRSVSDGTIGEIVISDLSRELLPLIRYRIGDVVQVHHGSGAHNRNRPTVSVLGRSKNTVRFAGIPIYEMQISRALDEALVDRAAEWRLVSGASEAAPCYQLMIEPATHAVVRDSDRTAIYDALRRQRSEINDVDLRRIIEIAWIERLEQAPAQGDAKARRFTVAE